MAKQALPEPTMFAEIGTSGYRWSGGLVFDHSAKELRGGREAAKQFAEMHDFLPVVRAGIVIFQLLVRQSSFRLEAKDDSPQAQEVKDHVAGCLGDMEDDFATAVLPDALSMLVYGYALMEETYKLRQGDKPEPVIPPASASGAAAPWSFPKAPPASKFNDGRVGWKSIALRSQKSLMRWDIDEAGRARAFWQLDPNLLRGMVRIPMSKALLFRTEHAGGNPEGRSLLSAAYKSWVLIKRLLEREAIGLARDLSGIPTFGVPPAIVAANPKAEDKATRDRVERLLQGLTADEMAYVLYPLVYDRSGKPMWEFKLAGIEGPARNFGAIGDAIARHEHRVATSMLTAFLLLGQDQVGTQALAENNADMLLLAANAVADTVAGEFTRTGIPRLVRANGWPAELSPIMVPSRIKRAPTLKELADYLRTLSDVGVLMGPDEALARQLRDKADLVPPSEEL